ncbi:MAG: LamB/YcsF family protein [Methylobacteriaceae bacterium]|nr:LamB/YcsF family protein [Methylobacteriaceae bacterium]
MKCHGALGNLCEVDRPAAEAVGRAIKAVDPKLVWLTIAAGEQVRAAETIGSQGVAGIFADRGYTEEGHLIPRGQPGAMILDPDEAAARMVEMVQEGAIITASGKRIPLTAIGSICVHGDSAHAVESARRFGRGWRRGVRVQAGLVSGGAHSVWLGVRGGVRMAGETGPYLRTSLDSTPEPASARSSSNSARRSIPRSTGRCWRSTPPSSPRASKACARRCRPIAR